MTIRPLEIWNALAFGQGQKELHGSALLEWFRAMARGAHSRTEQPIDIPTSMQDDIIHDVALEIMRRGAAALERIRAQNPELFPEVSEPGPTLDRKLCNYTQVMLGHRYLTVTKYRKQKVHGGEVTVRANWPRMVDVDVELLPSTASADRLSMTDTLQMAFERAVARLPPEASESMKRTFDEMWSLLTEASSMPELVDLHLSEASNRTATRDMLYKRYQIARERLRAEIVELSAELGEDAWHISELLSDDKTHSSMAICKEGVRTRGDSPSSES